jgi:hypothetical protein
MMFLVCSHEESHSRFALPVAWACDPALCSRHVWRRQSLLRCQRDQGVFSIPPHPPTPNITVGMWRQPIPPAVRYDAKAGERSLDVMR